VLASIHIAQSLQRALDGLLGFIPNLLGFLVILLVGFLIARVVKGVIEQLSRVVDWAPKKYQAATLSSVVVSSSVTLVPSLNVAPSSSSLTSSAPLIIRQRSWAASSSL